MTFKSIFAALALFMTSSAFAASESEIKEASYKVMCTTTLSEAKKITSVLGTPERNYTKDNNVLYYTWKSFTNEMSIYVKEGKIHMISVSTRDSWGEFEMVTLNCSEGKLYVWRSDQP